MLTVRLIAPGELKESYLRDAVAEYEKRLGAYCRVERVAIKEVRLPERPGEGEIRQALEAEADKILEKIPPRSYAIALCIEGKMLSSEALAERVKQITLEGYSELCLIIGSSHGLSDRVKSACQMRLSISPMTFPHQLMRVMLYEILYRTMNIIAGGKYHK